MNQHRDPNCNDGDDSKLTCWTIIEAAARGVGCERDRFVRIYLPVVKSFLQQRWQYGLLVASIDDATQEVLMECLKEEGPLRRAERDRGDFRGYLYGVVRNVARRFEEKQRRQPPKQDGGTGVLAELPNDEESLSRLFDRSWARGMMKQAAERQRELASGKGDEARQRIRLLQERFHTGLAIREIASNWNKDAAYLHRQYAKARTEFRDSLMDVLAFHHPRANKDELDRECQQLLRILQK